MKHISVQSVREAASGDAGIAVNATADVYTKPNKINYASTFVLMYKATVAAGTPDVDLYLEQSDILPTDVSGGAETDAGDADNRYHQIGSKLADITDELWHSVTISPVALPYLRFKADGQGANPATCVLTLKLGTQEEIF